MSAYIRHHGRRGVFQQAITHKLKKGVANIHNTWKDVNYCNAFILLNFNKCMVEALVYCRVEVMSYGSAVLMNKKVTAPF